MRALGVGLSAAAVVVCWPGLAWVAAAARRGDDLPGLLVGIAAIALAGRDATWKPTFPAWAVALAAASPLLASLAAARVGPLDVLEGLGMAATLVGILGVWGLPRRAALPLLGALILALPVGDVADAILAWPLRKALAGAAAALLSAVSPAEISAGTALAVEGGTAHVDVPCAGLRGLFSLGSILLVGALWTRSRLDARWLAASATGVALFLAANLVRIVAVVGLGHVAGWPLAADVVHQPLGVLGFALAAGASLAILRETPTLPEPPSESPRLAILAAAAWLTTTAIPAAAATATVSIAPPAHLAILEPSAPELAFAAEHGATVLRVGATSPPATVALVTARSWLAHHVPRQCLEAAGWSVQADRPADIGGSARIAELSRGERRATAVWWLQSADRSTDDVTVRILDGMAGGGPWVLVSVLADGARDAEDPELTALVSDLRAHVHAQLTAPEAP